MKRRLNDVGAIRKGMFESARKATEGLFPVENEMGRMEVENLHYTGDDPTKADERKAVMTGGSLFRSLRGDVVLKDAEGNEIDRRSRRIAKVPYLTGRGTFIYNGNDYTIPNQANLRPGVYSRLSQTGKPQAPINTSEGPNMKLQYEPSNGEFRLRVGNARLKLYPILKAAGLDDEAISERIGEAALKANRSHVDSRALSRVAGKLTESTDTENLGERLRSTMEQYGIDPDISEVTLGERYENVSPEMLLSTAQSLLDIYKNGEVSSRDAMYAQPLRTPEIQMADQIKQGKRKLSRSLWKALNKKSLDAVPAGVLDDRSEALFYEMGLAKPLEELNPLEALDEMSRVTRGGTDGLSGHAVPEEARYIHPSELGFLDPTRTPECYDQKTEVYTRDGWKFWSEVDEEDHLACRIDNQLEFHTPDRVIRKRYKGPMFGFRSGINGSGIDYLVTPNHNMWVRGRWTDEDESNYDWRQAEDMDGMEMKVLTSHQPWEPDTPEEFTLPPLPDGERQGVSHKDISSVTQEDWARLIAWYMSEGNTWHNSANGGWIIKLSKRDPDGRSEMLNLLDRFPYKAQDSDEDAITWSDKRLSYYLSQFGVSYEKYIPDWIMGSSVHIRRTFLDVLIDGDGGRGKYGSRFRTTSPKMANQVLNLASSLGIPSRYYISQRDDAHDCYAIELMRSSERSLHPPSSGAPTKQGYTYYTAEYDGMVYCAEVPGHLLYVRRGNGTPFWCGNSSSIGIDNRAAQDVYVDEDGEMYTMMENAQTGEAETVGARQLKDLTVSWPDQRGENEPFAVIGGRKMGHVPADEVDYFLPSAESLHSDMTGLSPMVSTAHGGRALMSAKFALQALPLSKGETPLVQVQTSAGDTMEQRLGRRAGTEHAEVGGVVQEVDDDGIVIEDDKGNTHRVDLYNNFPMNRKTKLNQTPLVQAGDRVEPGQLLAHSNYTSPEGTLQMGANLRTAFLPRGETFEDAVVISEKAAREKLTANQLKQAEVDTRGDTNTGRDNFISEFPDKYRKEQLQKVDEDGVIKVGETVEKDDPLILAVGNPKRNPYYYDLHKTSAKGMDESVVWDQPTEGRVMDVAKTDEGTKVYVETDQPAQEGDKLGTRYGGKGIMTVIPTEDMPQDENGEPFDLAISSLATTSRRNPGLAEEAMLGKLAEHTGETVKVPLAPEHEDDESFYDMAKRRLAEAGLKETETIYDPRYEKEVKDVSTGTIYGYRMKQTAKGKSRARGVAEHSAEGLPSTGGQRGGKKIGRQPMNALLSHGATDFIEEAQKLKGASNPEVWDALRAGKDIKMPDVPYSHRKMFDLLRGAGIDVRKQGNNLHIMPLRDSEVEDVSKGGIETSDMLDRQTMRPVEGTGGLFDPALTGGPGGSRWTHIDLPSPIPNPTMQRPIARMLNIPQKGVREVVAGKREINGETGPEAISKALGNLDVQGEMRRIQKGLGDMSKTRKDKEIKRLRHFKMLDKYDIDPQDLMINKVPVLPPKARPVSDLPGLDVPVMQSSNMLYKDLIDFRNAMRDTDLPDEDMGPYKGRLYDSVKAVYGLGEPVTQESKQKELSGILDTVFGSSPKHSYMQQNVVSKPQNMSGLSVISPNNSLKLNEVGMPKSLAWKAYEPLIVRKLTKRGKSPIRAMRDVRDKNKAAQQALKEAVEDRPVIVNRAPTLHKTGMVALHPRLTDGESLEVSPPLVDTLGADFDGNCCVFNTQIACKLDREVLQSTQRGRNFISCLEERFMKAASDTDVLVQDEEDIVRMEIGNFPRIGEPMTDDNGADVYEVPEGVRVLSYDHETSEKGYYDVTHLTVEHDTECRRVETRYGRTVEVSANESLCVFDPESGDLTDVCPDDAQDMMVPCIGTDEIYGDFGDKDIGWWYGSFLSDGWFDPWSNGRVVGYSKSEDAKRDRFVEIARDKIEDNFTYKEYEGSIDDGVKLGDSVKIHITGDLSDAILTCYIPPEERGSGRSCLYKTIPDEILLNGTRECLIGLLCGLLDGDGTMTWNTAATNPRMVFRYSTSSDSLKDDIKLLCWKLGVRCNVTISPPRGHSREAYTVTFSIPDMAKLLPEMEMVGESETRHLEEFIDHVDGNPPNNYSNFIPITEDLRTSLMKDEGVKDTSIYHSLSSANQHHRLTRETAKRAIRLSEGRDDHPDWSLFCRLAEADTILWDRIENVEEIEPQDTYDLSVPDTKVFATSSGMVIYDTMLFHVPLTKGAVRDAEEKMLPTRNLISPRDAEPVFNQTKEVALGLWLATRDADEGRKPVSFSSREEAMRAMRRGEIDPDQPITIAE